MRSSAAIGCGHEPRWKPRLAPADPADRAPHAVTASPVGAGKKQWEPGASKSQSVVKVKPLVAKPQPFSSMNSTGDAARWALKRPLLPFADEPPAKIPRRPRRDELREARAKRRSRGASHPQTAVPTPTPTPAVHNSVMRRTHAALTHAEQASIAKSTREWYTAAYEEFLAWARLEKRPMDDLAAIDETLVQLLDVMFHRGEDAGHARAVIFGTMFCLALPKGATTLPRCRRALRGFLKDAPPVSNDPVPIEAAVVLVDALLDSSKLEEKLAGLAFISAFDLFLRPSETLTIRKEDVIAPRRGQYQSVSVIVAPSALVEARLTVKTQKAAKSGEFDDTVVAGLPGLGLEWVSELVWQLAKGTPSKTAIFAPLSLAVYERIIGSFSQKLGVGRFTPHGARHGGPSLAMYRKILDLGGIQKRGRWLASSSVRRYEKSGKLTRQAAKLDKDVFVKAAVLLKGVLAKKALAQVKEVVVERRCLELPARPAP